MWRWQGDPVSQQLSKWIGGMTGQPLPRPPLATIDEFIYLSLPCPLRPRPSAGMKMNSPAVKGRPGGKNEGEKKSVLTIPQWHIYFILKGRFEVTLQSFPTDISQLDIQ